MPHSAYHLPHPLSLHAQRKSLPLRRSGANFIIYSLTRRDDDNADYVPHGEWEKERDTELGRNLLIRATLTATASGTSAVHPHEFYAIHLMCSPRCHLNGVAAFSTKMNCTLHFATGLRGV